MSQVRKYFTPRGVLSFGMRTILEKWPPGK
jgi:hypothetical protein